MPNLERGRVKETRPFYFLSFFNSSFSILNFQSCRQVCYLLRVNFFHYLCVYENSDKYNIDRINLISFIHCCYLFNRGKD